MICACTLYCARHEPNVQLLQAEMSITRARLKHPLKLPISNMINVHFYKSQCTYWIHFFHINETEIFFTIHKTQILKISITVRQPSPRNVNHLSSSSNIFLVLKFQLKNDNSTILQYLSKMWSGIVYFFPRQKKHTLCACWFFF